MEKELPEAEKAPFTRKRAWPRAGAASQCGTEIRAAGSSCGPGPGKAPGNHRAPAEMRRPVWRVGRANTRGAPPIRGSKLPGTRREIATHHTIGPLRSRGFENGRARQHTRPEQLTTRFARQVSCRVFNHTENAGLCRIITKSSSRRKRGCVFGVPVSRPGDPPTETETH